MPRPSLRLSLGLGFTGLAAVFAGPAAAASAAPCAPVASPVDESAMTVLINQERVAQGVKKVKANAPIQKPARVKSMAMARGARFVHSDSMVWADGRAAGQNIASAPSTPDAFAAMMQSPGHRENILNTGWRLTGVGAARNCQGTLFFTINLVAPAP